MIHEQENIDIIINGCKKGNRRSQEQLYKNFYRAMVTLCLRYTRDEQDAVEVLNNGFLKVFKNIQRYDPAQGTLYTWIRTIVINSCLDFIKVRQRTESHLDIEEVPDAHIPAEVIGKMDTARLIKFVRQLPPATQTVFNLYVMEGYNHREIAELLGIKEGTSKWHLSEARKTLQQMIQLNGINS